MIRSGGISRRFVGIGPPPVSSLFFFPGGIRQSSHDTPCAGVHYPVLQLIFVPWFEYRGQKEVAIFSWFIPVYIELSIFSHWQTGCIE